MTAPSSVICAKPASGMGAPPTSRETPAACTAAAVAVVAAAAATPTVRVVLRRELRFGMVIEAVIDTAHSFRSAAPVAPLTMSTNARG